MIVRLRYPKDEQLNPAYFAGDHPMVQLDHSGSLNVGRGGMLSFFLLHLPVVLSSCGQVVHLLEPCGAAKPLGELAHNRK
jgi:hypothetical protein